jgi:ketosteroid isomerase-like protein
MSAKSPEEICALFKQSVAAGDLDSLLSPYDEEAVFLNESGESLKGRDGLRKVLAPLAAARPRFEYDVRQIIQSGDTALMHTDWKAPALQPGIQYAIEVARRQLDGSWRRLIGDPFTVDRRGVSPRN